MACVGNHDATGDAVGGGGGGAFAAVAADVVGVSLAGRFSVIVLPRPLCYIKCVYVIENGFSKMKLKNVEVLTFCNHT